MTITRMVATTAGPVEITRTEGDRPTVLFFPGGHCRASTDCGQGIYTALGHEVISFSRPGYGRTRVGPMDAESFADVVREVCEQLGMLAPAAAVGVSFGGLQAVHVAGHRSIGVERLVLHSSAPSTLPYPDTRAEALLGPLVSGGTTSQRLTRTGPAQCSPAWARGRGSRTTSAKPGGGTPTRAVQHCDVSPARHWSPLPGTTAESSTRTPRTSRATSPAPASSSCPPPPTSSGSDQAMTWSPTPSGPS